MFGSSRARTIALASVGSGSVSFGIVECAAGKPCSIVASERLALPLEERTREQTIAALKQRLIDAGRRVLTVHAGGGVVRPITSVHCVIRAPWTRSRTVRAETNYEHEVYMNQEMITELAQRALDDARAVRASFLEASVMQVALNGYTTADPEGKRAHKAEIAALICAVDPSLRSAAQEALATLFPSTPARMHSGVRAILEGLRSEDVGARDLLVLDVAQDGTAAIVMREGVVESEGYIAEGERSMLTRALPKHSPEETLAGLRMMAREECDPALCASVEAAFAKMEPELARVFGEFFAAIGTPQRLPGAIMLIAHPDLAPWLTRFFSRIDFAQFTEVSQPFEVTPFRARHTPPTDAHEENERVDTDLLVALALINKQGKRG